MQVPHNVMTGYCVIKAVFILYYNIQSQGITYFLFIQFLLNFTNFNNHT